MAESNELECQPCAGTGKIRMIFDIVPGRMPAEPEVVRSFDPTAEETLFIPRLRGG
jgi:hypothetical protein